MSPRRRSSRLRCLRPALFAAATLALAACESASPGRFVASAVPPSPDVRWIPPSDSVPPVPTPAPAAAALAGLAATAETPYAVSLGQAVDLALKANPGTRASWARARSAAADVGDKTSAFWPSVELDLGATRQKQAALGGRSIILSTTWGPTATFGWTLLDFGGRRADVAESRRLLDAARFSHDATINDIVLDVAQAYYAYEGAKSLLAAAEASLKSAEENSAAATERRKAGVATIADVLQAKTAVSQQKLGFETAKGRVETIRGALATALGVPANLPVEAGELPVTLDVDAIETSVDGLLRKAAEARPDLAAVRARALASREKIRSSKSALLPTLGASGSAGRVFYEGSNAAVPHADTWSLGVALRWPVFDGFSRRYALAKAEEDAKVAAAEAESFEQQVVLQVWTSFYSLRTAAQSVRAAKDLLASATESVDVTRGRYKAGVGSILDLLVAESALADARARDVEARAGFLLALSQLAHDTGDADVFIRAAGPEPGAPKKETP